MQTSQQIAETYLQYADDGDLEGTSFVVLSGGVRIYQEVDDEEPSKYDVVEDEVDPETWERFLILVC